MGASGLGQLLVEEGLIQEFDRRTIRRTSGNQACAFAKGIVALGLFDEEQLASFLTEFTKFDRVPKDFSEMISPDTFSSIDPNLIMRLEVLPLLVDGRYLTVAIADPLDHSTIRQLEFFTGYKVKPLIATNAQIAATIKKLIPSFQPSMTPLQRFLTNHVDAAAYHRRVIDMSDPELKFDTPQSSAPVNFESPRSDDNEFEELSLDDDFDPPSQSVNDADHDGFDLQTLGAIDGDDAHFDSATDHEAELTAASASSPTIADELSDLNSLDDSNTADPAAADFITNDSDDLSTEAATDDLGLSDISTDTSLSDESDGLELPAVAADTDVSLESPDPIDDILNQPVGISSEQTQTGSDDDLEIGDNLLDELGAGAATDSEEVAKLVADTLETGGNAVESSDSSEKIEPISYEANTVNAATADDLNDIISELPDDQDDPRTPDSNDTASQDEAIDLGVLSNFEDEEASDQVDEVPSNLDDEHLSASENDPAPVATIEQLRAMADSAIADLNRAMVSMNASTSKEDICQVFARAVGSRIPVGALLMDRGGVIEPICAWSDAGEVLTWDALTISDASVLALAQLESGSWSSQQVQGLNIAAKDDFLVHLTGREGHRVYMVGQPQADLQDSLRRHVERMLKAIAKRL